MKQARDTSASPVSLPAAGLAHGIDTRAGWAVLCIVQCAAMIDLAAAPLWVGTLMKGFTLDARQAGALVSLYIGASVLAGLLISSQFNRLRSPGTVAAVGLAVAAFCFASVDGDAGFLSMAVMHVLAGLGAGPAVSVIEGTIGRSRQPHRLFALTAVALSVTAAAFLAILPWFMRAYGSGLFFAVIACILGTGAVCSVLFFPVGRPGAVEAEGVLLAGGKGNERPALTNQARLVLAGLFFMSANHSMALSFVERVGDARGYGAALVTAVLSAMAFIKLFPAAIAGALEHRLPVWRVLVALPVVQAAFCALLYGSPLFATYALAACGVIGALVFTHVFAFGLLAKIDPSSRAIAMSPAIMMAGSACGPVLGGSLIKAFDYSALAVAGVMIGALAVSCFARSGLIGTGPAGPAFSAPETI